jgi:replicative DNA helicase
MRVGETVGLFSLEMSKEQLALRLLCADARIDAHKLRTGKLNEKDWARLAKAYTDLSQAKLFIDDSATISPLEMRAKCRRLKAEFGLGLVIVDYLQLVTGAGRAENRQQELSAISRSMKGLAKELSCPVLALSQLSRAPEARTDRRPQLSDLRECVTGDTLVLLADGRRVPVADLVGQSPEVLAVSAEQRIVHATSDKVWKVGRRPVFDVRLAGGGSVRASAPHRLLGRTGWARVSRLQPGDSLATAARAGGGVSWDRVARIEPAGEEDVYDLTVPGPASWLADGIVSHNSGALEQDADIVMFIYREEEYKPTDENRGIAEIIIGKQRNGPTGSRKLAFIKEFTRFENLEWHAPERSPV